MEIISEKPPLTIKLFEKGQLDAETQIKYKLYFFPHQSHLRHPKANSRSCGQLRGKFLVPPETLCTAWGATGNASSTALNVSTLAQDRKAWLLPRIDCAHIKEGTSTLPSSRTCSEENWPLELALPDFRHQPENLEEYYKITKHSESNLSISLPATPQELALE